MIYDSRHDLKNRLNKAQASLNIWKKEAEKTNEEIERCEFYATVIVCAIFSFMVALSLYALVMS